MREEGGPLRGETVLLEEAEWDGGESEEARDGLARETAEDEE